jgi:hypothetical protein
MALIADGEHSIAKLVPKRAPKGSSELQDIEVNIG